MNVVNVDLGFLPQTETSLVGPKASAHAAVTCTSLAIRVEGFGTAYGDRSLPSAPFNLQKFNVTT